MRGSGPGYAVDENGKVIESWGGMVLQWLHALCVRLSSNVHIWQSAEADVETI